jgi:hypothetical protein
MTDYISQYSTECWIVVAWLVMLTPLRICDDLVVALDFVAVVLLSRSFEFYVVLFTRRCVFQTALTALVAVVRLQTHES